MRSRFAAACIAALAIALGDANAVTLVIDERFAQELVAKGLFKDDNGRWYLKTGDDCYAYLEYPKVSLVKDRLRIDAHLSSRLGPVALGRCLGVGFASDLRLSGRPVAKGTSVLLEDIKLDFVKDAATSEVLDLVNRAAGSLLPKIFEVDLLPEFTRGLSQVKGVQLELEGFSVTQFRADPGRITLEVDFRLRAH
jgi:hypothetical protein